jgi:hypothetical protein
MGRGCAIGVVEPVLTRGRTDSPDPAENARALENVPSAAEEVRKKLRSD